MVILYLGLSLAILSGTVLRLVPFSGVGLYPQDVLVTVIFLLNISNILHYVKNNVRKLFPLFVFAGAGMFGLFLNTKTVLEFSVSIAYLIRLLLYLSVAIPLLGMSKSNLSKILKSMLITGFLFVGIGYMQYFFYPNLRNLYYLGWDEHLYRLFSTFLDPNFAGIFITLITLLFIYYVLISFKKANLQKKILFSFGFAFLFVSLMLTYSRSSFISFICSMVLLLILLGRRKLVGAVLLLFVFGIFLLPKNIGGEGVNLLRTASIFQRTQTYQQAFTIFFHNPAFGVGFDSLRFVSQRYGFVSQKDALTSHSASGIPDSFLFILATTGIVGFVSALLLLFAILSRIYKDTKTKPLSVVVFVSLVAILIDSIFENTLFFAQIVLWQVILTGIFFGLGKKTTDGKKP